MWKYVLLLAILCGCASDPLTRNPREMDPDELGKHITFLWKECEAGVLDYYDVPKEDYEGRIAVLEKAYPYGKRVFQIARDKSHRANLHFAQCAALLGQEYELLARKQLKEE